MFIMAQDWFKFYKDGVEIFHPSFIQIGWECKIHPGKLYYTPLFDLIASQTDYLWNIPQCPECLKRNHGVSSPTNNSEIKSISINYKGVFVDKNDLDAIQIKFENIEEQIRLLNVANDSDDAHDRIDELEKRLKRLEEERENQ